MKYLKLFEELYGNAGSMYGWDKVKKDPAISPLSQYPGDGPIVVYHEEVFPYKCNNCNIEFYSVKGDDVKCKYCHSENVEPINYI